MKSDEAEAAGEVIGGCCGCLLGLALLAAFVYFIVRPLIFWYFA
jgi:hypothetical protein